MAEEGDEAVSVALPTLNGISFCAGVGMLDEGVRLAFEYLGFEYRTVCYVEREVAAAAQLVALMESGCLDPAPVWSDLTTFDTRRWRGCVDVVTAGFPCQPHSVAGRRAGLDDDRWIWPDIARLIGELGPKFVALENVPGLASTGGLDAVIADLAVRGYSAEWARLSASAVGASHERERLFILGWLGDAECSRRSTPGHRREEHPRREPESRCGQVADARRECEGGHEQEPISECGGTPDAVDAHRAMADTSGARLQGRELSGAHRDERHGSQAHGPVVELRRAFAPGPSDEVWEAYCSFFPFLAPAVESGVCVLADGLALVVDESRTDQLRAIGNGVVALTAACAYVELARRAGIA